MPASNVTRLPEEGCMKKLKIERAVKLQLEDSKGKSYNIITGSDESG